MGVSRLAGRKALRAAAAVLPPPPRSCWWVWLGRGRNFVFFLGVSSAARLRPTNGI